MMITFNVTAMMRKMLVITYMSVIITFIISILNNKRSGAPEFNCLTLL